jgi:hypothetical protein
METFLEQPIKVFDVCSIVSAKKLKGSGLNLGDEVLVMSSKDVAFKKSDPWVKRTIFIVAKVVEGVPLIPNHTNEYKAIVVDPRSLEKVSDERQDTIHKGIAEKAGNERE